MGGETRLERALGLEVMSVSKIVEHVLVQIVRQYLKELEAKNFRRKKKCLRGKKDKIKLMLGEDVVMGYVMSLCKKYLTSRFFEMEVLEKSLI